MGYTFNDIITNPKDMPEFLYEMDSKIRRYYPDIFIPNEHLIIEVKSSYTLNIDLDKNNLKFEAVKKAGYNFDLRVY